MTDRPIIFSAPMILALLDGRKTMTRRLAWRRDPAWGDAAPIVGKERDYMLPTPWQRVAPGDRLWVRETWRLNAQGGLIEYRADWTGPAGKWRSPIHMPRHASRLTLTVTGTKIEKLQMIRNADIKAEGIEGDPPKSVVFSALWDMLHGLGAWAKNPEVVALSFTVHPKNIVNMEAA